MAFRTHFVDPVLKRRIDQYELALELVDAVRDHYKPLSLVMLAPVSGVLLAGAGLWLMVMLDFGAMLAAVVTVGLCLVPTELLTRWARHEFQPLLDRARAQGLDPAFISEVAWDSPTTLMLQHNAWLVGLRWALYQADRPMTEAARRALVGDLLVHRTQLDHEQMDFVDAMLDQYGATLLEARVWASCLEHHDPNKGCTQCVWPGRRGLYRSARTSAILPTALPPASHGQ